VSALIAVFVLLESWPVLRHAGPAAFITGGTWRPTAGLYDLTPMLWGTMLTMCGSVALATPLGVASAVFSRYYAPPPLAAVYRRMIEILAGIPSVVYGFWGLVVVVPLIGRLHPPGPSLLAGTLILALMILPTIALMADASLATVPKNYALGAAALGLTRWATIRRVLLPAAKSGLFTGVVLAAGRAIGETMAILMVAGNVVQFPRGIFDPVRTLTANIALEMAYAMGDHRSALFVSGLVLLCAISALVLLAERVDPGSAHE